jgi:hypothetical protein
MLNKFSISFLIVIIFNLKSIGQIKKYQSFQSFIPKGLTMIDSACGDLNQDGNTDIVLILESKETGVRPLLLLEGDGKGKYSLFARNDVVVLREMDGGMCCDPYQHITIKKEFFSLEYYGGDNNVRWTRVTTFKYDQIAKQFILHKDASILTDPNEDPKTKQYVPFNKKDFDKLPFIKYSNGDN